MKHCFISKRKYPIGTPTHIISARVPLSLINKLNVVCKETGRSKSDIITQILEEFISDYEQNL